MKPLIVILLMLAAPSTAALVEEDPAGDVEGMPGASIVHPELDLRRLVLEDQGAEILVEIQVEDLQTIHGQAVYYYLDFEVGQQEYRLEILQGEDRQANLHWTVELVRGDEWSRNVRFHIEPGQGVATAWLPRDWLSSQDGIPLWGTQGLRNIVVTTAMSLPQFLGVPLGDRLPNEDFLEWTTEYGLSPSPPFDIHITKPLRQSNGGVQSFVYPIEIENAPAGTYEWELQAAPRNWMIAHPEFIEIGNNGHASEAVLVSLPGAHSHGDVEEVRFRLVGPETADFVVGISFARPAFPTGHHPDLFLHARSSGDARQGFMNTAMEDALDAQLPVPFPGALTEDMFDRFLRIGLEPRLGMGLLADLSRNATIDIDVAPSGTYSGITLQGQVLMVANDSRSVLWEFPRTAYFAPPGAQEPVNYQASGTWVGGDALVVPSNETNLVLEIVATELLLAVGSEPAAELLPGGVVHLPLLEYVDDVQTYFEKYTSLSISTEEANIIRLAPGSTAVLPILVENPTNQDARLAVSATESVEGWTGLQQPDLRIPAHQERTIKAIVEVPEQAVGQNEIRIVFHENGRLVGVESFSVFVDPFSSRDDVVPQDEAGAAKTPSLSGLLVGLLVFAMAGLARRPRNPT